MPSFLCCAECERLREQLAREVRICHQLRQGLRWLCDELEAKIETIKQHEVRPHETVH